jgi:hypothetical protein
MHLFKEVFLQKTSGSSIHFPIVTCVGKSIEKNYYQNHARIINLYTFVLSEQIIKSDAEPKPST